MIKVNGIEVTKGCTVKLRCGGSAEVFDRHECLSGEDGKRPVNLLFSEKARSGMTFLHNGKHQMGQTPFDIIEVIPPPPTFKRGDRVRKKGNKGQWQGHIVGEYSTECTPEGYAVESERELNSVQIYPASALEYVEDIT